jgi:hypothetical protein
MRLKTNKKLTKGQGKKKATIYFLGFIFYNIFFLVFPFLFFTLCFWKKYYFLFFKLEIFITLHLVYFHHLFCSYLHSFVIFLFFFFTLFWKIITQNLRVKKYFYCFKIYEKMKKPLANNFKFCWLRR